MFNNTAFCPHLCSVEYDHFAVRQQHRVGHDTAEVQLFLQGEEEEGRKTIRSDGRNLATNTFKEHIVCGCDKSTCAFP